MIFFNIKTYYACIEYVERYYYPLFPYQKFIYAFFFTYENDKVVFNMFLVLIGRGNGKDGLMAPLIIFLQTKKYSDKNTVGRVCLLYMEGR